MTTDQAFIAKLQHILALTTSPIEGEAQAAAAMLQKLLTSHNLSMADLEQRGSKVPGVREDSYDLGKAAFQWKLNLAEAIADHYYCHAIIANKQVTFIGRPDNIEALKMLYAWLIDQIRRIAKDARVAHIENTNEHIDPLRWQVNFGVGAVSRLRVRLQELSAQQDVSETALVVHHKSEISDYMEAQYGWRVDGRPTRKWAEYVARAQAREEQMAADRIVMNDEVFYTKYPGQRPLTPEQVAAQAAEEKRQARNASRRKGRTSRPYTEAEYRKMDQGWDARQAGHKAADSMNLQPFIAGPASGERVGIDA